MTPDRVREVKERFPELRVIPRLVAGAVARFGTEPGRAVASMREFVAYR